MNDQEQKRKKNQKTYTETLHAADRFEKLKDGWIKDNLLGIDWALSSEERMDFAGAEKYCADKGGRLPNVQELQTIIDYSKETPAVISVFDDTKTDDWYWSGTDTSWSKRSAWCVGLGSGHVYDSGKVYYNYVRPVRASQ